MTDMTPQTGAPSSAGATRSAATHAASSAASRAASEPAATERTPTRVLLIGMMASGKTTVGRELERLTGWPYVDNDELVVRLAGHATPDVAAVRGADGLHMLEGFVVEEILGMEAPLIAGLPGSAIQAPPMRAAIRAGGHVVWLRARMETLAARAAEGGDRPFFAGHDVLETLRRLNQGREPLYAATAHFTVDVDDREPAVIAAEILAHLP